MVAHTKDAQRGLRESLARRRGTSIQCRQWACLASLLLVTAVHQSGSAALLPCWIAPLAEPMLFLRPAALGRLRDWRRQGTLGRTRARAARMVAGSWWDGPRAEDVREMSELLSMDPCEMERTLPERKEGAVTYSRKVFIPLTRLCRDRCSYCTFATHDGPSHPSSKAYLSKAEVLEIALEGQRQGCTEALFTLGDRPEARWQTARDELAAMKHSSTISYLAECCELVLQHTSLLPHVNPGVCSEGEIAVLRRVSVSQGLMLESLAPRLMVPGAPHHRSPDKAPNRRLAVLEAAGRQRTPFTTGILIGIGESRLDRLEALAAIRQSHLRWGHIQEVIVQPFRHKDGTGMAASPDASSAELEWTIMAAVRSLPLVPCGLSNYCLDEPVWEQSRRVC
jgi:7,8-didemethyl-8-hydroxy-5-deazariboflavin synthase CofG subunit